MVFGYKSRSFGPIDGLPLLLIARRHRFMNTWTAIVAGMLEGSVLNCMGTEHQLVPLWAFSG
jgi:hypothetical protein